MSQTRSGCRAQVLSADCNTRKLFAAYYFASLICSPRRASFDLRAIRRFSLLLQTGQVSFSNESNAQVGFPQQWAVGRNASPIMRSNDQGHLVFVAPSPKPDAEAQYTLQSRAVSRNHPTLCCQCHEKEHILSLIHRLFFFAIPHTSSLFFSAIL